MKIIIINGSPRKNGATATILKDIHSNLITHSDAEVIFINLCDLELKFCSVCCSCYQTGKCIYKDDLEDLSKLIETADGLVLGSPTYASNVSAQMKLLIDRGHFVMEQLLSQKCALNVATYENYGGKDTLNILNQLILFSGAKLSGSILSKSSFNSNPLNDPHLKQKVSKLSQNLYKDIQKGLCHPFQKIFQGIIFHFGIKPFVLKKGDKYRGVVNHWKHN